MVEHTFHIVLFPHSHPKTLFLCSTCYIHDSHYLWCMLVVVVLAVVLFQSNNRGYTFLECLNNLTCRSICHFYNHYPNSIHIGHFYMRSSDNHDLDGMDSIEAQFQQKVRGQESSAGVHVCPHLEKLKDSALFYTIQNLSLNYLLDWIHHCFLLLYYLFTIIKYQDGNIENIMS